MALSSHHQIQHQVTALLSTGVADGVFPSASACIAYHRNGRDTCVHAHAGPHPPNTAYDLASLTKPFVAMTALRLADAHAPQLKLNLKAPLRTWLPETHGFPVGSASLEALFTHRAGLDAWAPFYKSLPCEPCEPCELGTLSTKHRDAEDWVIQQAAKHSRSVTNSAHSTYSDLGYMLAGIALARATKTPLHTLVADQITTPLGLHSVVYASALHASDRHQLTQQAPPTEVCPWRNRLLQGEVHDENCAALGGIAGHAGLFGNAHHVAAFGMAILRGLRGQSPHFSQASLTQALAPRPTTHPTPKSTHVFGWDTKSPPPAISSAGTQLSDQTFGHLGFTGTSLWCDPAPRASSPVSSCAIALLSNRVHPTRANNAVRAFRPRFHDAVIDVLTRSL